ncbi:CheR family methyltransferase [Rhizobium mongolense]|uniref:CheR family methyltransferase n=1 Tax=Rhizobium mongolense TaxID=57676 RepID=UPI0034A1BAD9
MHRTGRYIYRKFTRNTVRVQSHFTHFMRSPPLLEALADLASLYPQEATLRVASIGCSTGAELYSILYIIRRARPDLKVLAHGVDISSAVVEVAKRGIYRPDVPAGEDGLYVAGRAEVLSDDVDSLGGVLQSMPDGSLRVRDWLRENVMWLTADATDSRLIDLIGSQDILVANNFMGPMEDALAERCLRNMMRLVSPGGYLVVDGIDLDVKTQELKRANFKPVLARQEDIWFADGSKKGWPWLRWSREPIDRHQPGWAFRYSVIFHCVQNCTSRKRSD